MCTVRVVRDLSAALRRKIKYNALGAIPGRFFYLYRYLEDYDRIIWDSEELTQARAL